MENALGSVQTDHRTLHRLLRQFASGSSRFLRQLFTRHSHACFASCRRHGMTVMRTPAARTRCTKALPCTSKPTKPPIAMVTQRPAPTCMPRRLQVVIRTDGPVHLPMFTAGPQTIALFVGLKREYAMIALIVCVEYRRTHVRRTHCGSVARF